MEITRIVSNSLSDLAVWPRHIGFYVSEEVVELPVAWSPVRRVK
jgi:hypothetical protein